jgi:hypothetical protein
MTGPFTVAFPNWKSPRPCPLCGIPRVKCYNPHNSQKIELCRPRQLALTHLLPASYTAVKRPTRKAGERHKVIERNGLRRDLDGPLSAFRPAQIGSRQKPQQNEGLIRDQSVVCQVARHECSDPGEGESGMSPVLKPGRIHAIPPSTLATPSRMRRCCGYPTCAKPCTAFRPPDK